MSSIQIPNLPSAISLAGSEQLECVQAGVSVKVTTSQIRAFSATLGSNNLISANYTTTNGFSAGQLLMSDGTYVQVAGAAKATSLALNGASAATAGGLNTKGYSIFNNGYADPTGGIFGPATVYAYGDYTHNAIVSAVIQDTNISAAPTAVTGYAKTSFAGGSSFPFYAEARVATAGTSTTELDSFNDSASNPSLTMPPDRSSGTATVNPIALTIGAGGTRPSLVGIQFVKEGSTPQQFYYGAYFDPDAITYKAIWVGATAGASPVQSAFLQNSGGSGQDNLLLQTMSAQTDAYPVVRHMNASSVETWKITQSGSFLSTAGTIGLGTQSPGAQGAFVGANQATASFDTAGALGGALLVGDTGASGSSGGAIIFSANSQAWRFAAIKGLVTSGSSNSQGDIVISTRFAAADATLTEAFRVSSGYYKSTVFTVATLPSAVTAGVGAHAFVSDANATTYNSIVAAGGANKMPVISDGTNWRIG